jgi:hypothetical protein
MARSYGRNIRLKWNADVVLSYWRRAAALGRPRTVGTR